MERIVVNVRTIRQVHRLSVLPPSAARKNKDLRWLTPQYSAASSYQATTDTIIPHTVHTMNYGYSQHVPLRLRRQMCFFPASGNRNGTALNNRGANGNYWSASLNSQTNGYNLNFNSTGVNPANNNNRFNGFSVRAVQHSSNIVVLCL